MSVEGVHIDRVHIKVHIQYTAYRMYGVYGVAFVNVVNARSRPVEDGRHVICSCKRCVRVCRDMKRASERRAARVRDSSPVVGRAVRCRLVSLACPSRRERRVLMCFLERLVEAVSRLALAQRMRRAPGRMRYRRVIVTPPHGNARGDQTVS